MASSSGSNNAKSSETLKNRLLTESKKTLLLFNETYDESTDPDFTLSNNTAMDILEGDSDDDEDEEELDTDDGEVADLLDDQGSESDVDNAIEKIQTSLKNQNSSSSNSISSLASTSTVTLPIHKHFYSFIHKNEIPRKLFHVSIGFVTLYLHLHGYKTSNTWQPTSIAVSCIFLLDLIRFSWPYFNTLYCATVGFLMREKEINTINGVIWFQLGSIITFLFQKQDVAVMSILLLSWSDTAASTFGRKFGHLSPKISASKSLVGSIAAFFTGVFSCYLFYGVITPLYPQFSTDFQYDPQTNHINLYTLALLSGFIAALSEGIDIAGLDDNLTIPVFSGFFLSAVIKLGQ